VASVFGDMSEADVLVLKSIDFKLTSSYICQEFVQGQLINENN